MNHKKKIAILLYGHLRTYESTYKTLFDKIIYANKDIEFDIYLSVWLKKNTDGDDLNDKNIAKLKKIYNGSKVLIHTENDKSYIDYFNDHFINNELLTINVSYLIKQGIKKIIEEEKDFNKFYDYVLMTRPDIYFFQTIRLSDLLDKNSRGQVVAEDNPAVYFPYIISDYYGQIMDLDKYICGIDLFSILSRAAIDSLYYWDISKLGLNHLYPEHSLTINYKKHNMAKRIIGYEKDRSFFILRKRGVFKKILFSKYIQIFPNSLFYILFPFLLLSNKLRQKIFFNQHLLNYKNYKRLYNFLK